MRNHSLASLAVIALATATLSCAPADQGGVTEEDVAAINQAREMETEGVGSGDANTAVAAYTDDVVFMPPNEPTINGTAALRTWFADAAGMFDLNVEYTSSNIVVSGDWAIEHYAGTATFAPKDGSDAMIEQLKGIHIYRRQVDGTWKISHDVWNTDAPPPEM